MKTKLTVILTIIILWCTSVFAATKQDIIDYAASQEVCDSETSAIFNTYRNTFTRLVRQKSLTEQQCNQIMSYLTSSVGILNSKGVCSLSDLDKLTTAERNSIYANLSAGASIIINAETEGFESNKGTEAGNDNTNQEESSTVDKNVISGNNSNGSSGININKVDGTIDIYENGILIDKVEMTQSKLTYTGPDKTIIYIIVAVAVFIVACVVHIVIYAKHTRKLRAIKNILVAVEICSIILVVGIITLKPYINVANNLLSMLNTKVTNNEKEVVISVDKAISYPSYGYVYGTLSIDACDIKANIAFGDSSTILSESLGTASWSSMPAEDKNVVVSGHNSENMLRNLGEVSVGDEIVIDTTYAKCIYKVYKTDIINDTDVDKVKVDEEKETLVLYTCYPFSDYIYSNKRFAVYSMIDSVEWK